MRFLGLAAMLAMPVAGADLAAVLSERNLERRSRKALDHAQAALKLARQSYQRGEVEAVRRALEEVREAVELAYRSLRETGKDPVRHPRHFKHAELRTRELLKILAQFRDRMAFDDRELVEPVYKSVEHIHEELLLGIMGKKPK
ncbi:MAG: hypothetical protein NZ554_11545 [Bryobacteraceae bacterium]|nr:hypothetical protein [Bryobacteraceae bacterium]